MLTWSESIARLATMCRCPLPSTIARESAVRVSRAPVIMRPCWRMRTRAPDSGVDCAEAAVGSRTAVASMRAWRPFIAASRRLDAQRDASKLFRREAAAMPMEPDGARRPARVSSEHFRAVRVTAGYLRVPVREHAGRILPPQPDMQLEDRQERVPRVRLIQKPRYVRGVIQIVAGRSPRLEGHDVLHPDEPHLTGFLRFVDHDLGMQQVHRRIEQGRVTIVIAHRASGMVSP